MLACRLAILALTLAAASEGALKWRVRYFHDEDNSRFSINDLKFSSPERGVAVGLLVEGRRQQPMSVITRDGGRTWQQVKLRETGIALYFLDDTNGWMVTPEGIWHTSEGGLNWRKIHSRRGLRHVYFTTPERGWAVGHPKIAIETRDGGRTWTKIPVDEATKTTDSYTEYAWIDFVTPKVGMIVGRSKRPDERAWRRGPVWAEPEPGLAHAERPALALFLETHDGGETWKQSATSIFGRISRMRMEPSGRALSLIEFDGVFQHPSELIRVNLLTGKSDNSLALPDFAATDVDLVPQGPAYAAGVATPGKGIRSPIPGRVRVLRSLDLTNWTDMDVDYRAAATRVSISAVDAANLWIACDTGMILKLE